MAVLPYGRLDLTGQRFGALVALSPAPRTGRRTQWLCRCDCGELKPIITENLRGGNSRACGRCRRPPKGPIVHGHSSAGGKRTPTYTSWKAMRTRCKDAGRDGAQYYVGRGITYDPRWESFETFLADMGERPPGTTLDRIDPYDGYHAGNCRWATPKQQTRNRTNVVTVSFRGETGPLAAFAEEQGINLQTVKTRLRLGIEVDAALTMPVQRRRMTRHA